MPLDKPGVASLASGEAAGAKRPGLVIAVTSGKGGVGKTNVSVNLAVAMALRGRTAWMRSGVRPRNSFASRPTARMRESRRSKATTEGSLRTMPFFGV